MPHSHALIPLTGLVAAILGQAATDPGLPASPPPPALPAPPPTHPPDDATQSWLRAITPGEAHARLDALVGEWALTVRLFAEPGAPAQESTGDSTFAWVLGGRFLREDFTATMAGRPYTGLGFTGHDNAKGVFANVWMDSSSTAITAATGAFDEAAGTLTLTGEFTDPVSARPITTRSVYRFTDADHITFEQHILTADAQELKTLEVAYVRKKP